MKDTPIISILCTACDSSNGAPAHAPHARMVCGRCGAKLFDGSPVPLQRGRFFTHLRLSGIPVLIEFKSPKSRQSRVRQAAAKLEPYVRIAELDIEAEAGLARMLRVEDAPCFSLYRDGRELCRYNGDIAPAGLVNWVRTQIDLPAPPPAQLHATPAWATEPAQQYMMPRKATG